MGVTNFDIVDAGGGVQVNGVTAIDSSGNVVGAIVAPSGSISNAELATMASKTYKGRTSAQTGVAEDVPVATLLADLGQSGTNTGDNAANTNYSGLVTNATHTGEVTGSTGLTIAAKAVTVAKMADMGAEGHILVADATSRPVSVAVSGDATITAAGAVSVSDLSIANQAAGSILFFNGTNWVHLAAGTNGQTLKMNAGATAPEWVTV
jgi:hypothetical protein